MAATALNPTPITFQSSTPLSSQLHSKPATKISLTSTLKSTKLTIKPLLRRRTRGGGGASGARMADSAAASYANALADVAKSNDTLEQTTADLEKLEKIFAQEPVMKFFTNPTIIVEEKRKIVDEIVESAALQPYVANFLNILVDTKRIDLIKEILKEFEFAYNRFTGTETATVASVVALEAQHLAQIAKSVQKMTGAKNVRIKTVIDPSLVAGFTIRYGETGSKLIDMSVKKQLEEITSQLDLGDIQLAL
ncbi:hypothetical protein ACP275_03G016200 [Erythranthe tilingii]